MRPDSPMLMKGLLSEMCRSAAARAATAFRMARARSGTRAPSPGSWASGSRPAREDEVRSLPRRAGQWARIARVGDPRNSVGWPSPGFGVRLRDEGETRPRFGAAGPGTAFRVGGVVVRFQTGPDPGRRDRPG